MLDTPLDRISWNYFVAQWPHSPFLQSYEWGEFQEKMGHHVKRFVFRRNERECWVIQFFTHPLPAGFSYFYAPHGPVGECDEEQAGDFLEYVDSARRNTKAIFLRMESRHEMKNSALCRNQRGAPSLQPRTTLIIPLSPQLEELQAVMHPKTRYNIRVAQRHGVEVRWCYAPPEKTMEDFLSLLKNTARRDHFSLHRDSYYIGLFELFGKHQTGDMNVPFIRFYRALLSGRTLACAIIMFFGDTATYLHGASSSQHRNVMAPAVLHWQIIRDAKALGYQWYDFWGIARTNNPSDPWAGVTRFKKGFGGFFVTYPQSTDCVFSPILYTLYRQARRAVCRIKA